MLDSAAKQRFARQLLLAEIGEAGQERLCATRVHCSVEGDARAVAIASTYLERAGMQVTPGAGASAELEAVVPDVVAVRALAGASELEEAAASLAGALGAVEAIKRALGIGKPGSLDPGLSLWKGAER